MNRIEVRRADAGDAEALGEVHVRAWREAYRGLMPQEYLDGLDAGARAREWRDRLSGPGTPGTALLVGVLDGAVVGFAGHGPAHDDPAPGTGQLYGINVHPDAWGRGVGGAMLAATEDALRAKAYRAAVLWVVPGNARARAIYEHRGWYADGAEREENSFGIAVPVMRYRLPLG